MSKLEKLDDESEKSETDDMLQVQNRPDRFVAQY